MQKDQYWQKIRGICILAVVWIHASGFSNELNYNSFIFFCHKEPFVISSTSFIFLGWVLY